MHGNNSVEVTVMAILSTSTGTGTVVYAEDLEMVGRAATALPEH